MFDFSGSENLSKTTALFCDFGDFNTQELLPSEDKDKLTNKRIGESFLTLESIPRTSDKISSYHPNNQTGSRDKTPLKTSNSSFNLAPSHNIYSTRNHNESLASTVSSVHSQGYIKPLELRGSPLYFPKPGDMQATYQNYINRNLSEPPPLMPRPIPFTPVQAAPPPLPQRTEQQVSGLLTTQQIQATLNPPFLPPKQHQPPPYRPPPINKNQISGQSQPAPTEPPRASLLSNNQMLSPTNRLLMMPPIEEDVSYMSQEPLVAKSSSSKLRVEDNHVSSITQNHSSVLHSSNEVFQATNVNAGSSNSISNHSIPAAHAPLSGVGCGGSSDGGGSHDSHNDSGYCVGSSSASGRFGSGGPSPSLSGKTFCD